MSYSTYDLLNNSEQREPEFNAIGEFVALAGCCKVFQRKDKIYLEWL